MSNINDKFINYIDAHNKVTESTSNVISKMNINNIIHFTYYI